MIVGPELQTSHVPMTTCDLLLHAPPCYLMPHHNAILVQHTVPNIVSSCTMKQPLHGHTCHTVAHNSPPVNLCDPFWICRACCLSGTYRHKTSRSLMTNSVLLSLQLAQGQATLARHITALPALALGPAPVIRAQAPVLEVAPQLMQRNDLSTQSQPGPRRGA